MNVYRRNSITSQALNIFFYLAELYIHPRSVQGWDQPEHVHQAPRFEGF